jgi:hypothetical protein
MSIVRLSKNYKTQKLDLLPSSDEGRETPILLGPLQRANLNHWTAHVIFITAETSLCRMEIELLQYGYASCCACYQTTRQNSRSQQLTNVFI